MSFDNDLSDPICNMDNGKGWNVPLWIWIAGGCGCVLIAGICLIYCVRMRINRDGRVGLINDDALDEDEEENRRKLSMLISK